jgi:hypothetical protein
MKSTPNSILNRTRYLELNRKCQRVKRLETFNDESKILNSNNQNKFWKFIKSKLTYKASTPALLSNDGKIISDSLAKAEALNDFFASVFIKDDGLNPNWNITLSDNLLSDVEFEEYIIFKKIEKIPSKLSSGPDSIPSLLMKKCALTLAKPLSKLFSESFNQGILPNDWLLADVTPIFKNKGSNSNVNNYRPISLTCVPCRIMESVISDAIRFHVMDKISASQHGFLSGRSTVTQLLETLEDWTLSLDNNKVIDVLYIDIAKAFDSVSHIKLISKLELYGISGKLLIWIKAFLSNRKQRVVIDGTKSDWKEVTSGVPQGSILGPLLFLLYVNDLPKAIKNSEVKLFADDCKIYIAFKWSEDSSHLLQEDIDSISTWAESSQLSIAFSKCAILHLGNKNPKNEFSFSGNIRIPSVKSFKDLGVTISHNLKFGEHIDNIKKSASSASNLIHKCFSYKNPSFLIKMFNTFVRPKLEYASQVWNPVNRKDIKTLERVQRNFTKRIPGLRYLPYAERIRRLKTTTLELRRIHLDLIFTYKLCHNKMRIDKSKFFIFKTSQTRGHRLTIRKPKPNKIIRKSFYSSRIVDIWNSLPENIALAPNITTFKRELSNCIAVVNTLKRFLRGGDFDV